MNPQPWPFYANPRLELGTEAAGVAVCCNAAGHSVRKVAGQCTAGEAGEYNLRNTTFYDAKYICEAAGLRLCASQEELNTGCGTGCNYDHVLAWTEVRHPLMDACSRQGVPYDGYGSPRKELPAETAGAAVCCNPVGFSVRKVDGVCLGGEASPDNLLKTTFEEAKGICEAAGLRLCGNHAELNTGCGSGCNFDYVLAWVGDREAPYNLRDGCLRQDPPNAWPGYGVPRHETPTETAGVAVCCNAAGRSVRKVNGQCVAGHASRHNLRRSTFQDAKDTCEAHGLRLCKSQTELETGCGTGCNYDRVLAWVDLN